MFFVYKVIPLDIALFKYNFYFPRDFVTNVMNDIMACSMFDFSQVQFFFNIMPPPDLQQTKKSGLLKGSINSPIIFLYLFIFVR